MLRTHRCQTYSPALWFSSCKLLLWSACMFTVILSEMLDESLRFRLWTSEPLVKVHYMWEFLFASKRNANATGGTFCTPNAFLGGASRPTALPIVVRRLVMYKLWTALPSASSRRHVWPLVCLMLSTVTAFVGRTSCPAKRMHIEWPVRGQVVRVHVAYSVRAFFTNA